MSRRDSVDPRPDHRPRPPDVRSEVPGPAAPVAPGSPAEHARALRDGRLLGAQRTALASSIAATHGNRHLSRAVLARSPLSDELARLWAAGDKAAFFDSLRAATESLEDVLAFVDANLEGDDLWLARNIYFHGPEPTWPIHLRVEREMKGWADCRGTGAVFDILRAAAGGSSGDAELAAALQRVFHNLDTLWIAQQLQAHGPEAGWPPELRAELEDRRRAAVVSEMSRMLGEQATWTDSAGQVVREVTGAQATTFGEWAEADSETAAPKLGPDTTLNCWEMILLASYNAGSLGWGPIHEVYVKRPRNSDPNAWFRVVARSFTPQGTTRYTREKPGPRPAAGDIVLFDGVDHVALATGTEDELGRSLVLSFFPPKDADSVKTDRGTLGSAKLLTVDWLAAEMDGAGMTTTVKFGPPPW